jgi:hypothetical protein
MTAIRIIGNPIFLFLLVSVIGAVGGFVLRSDDTQPYIAVAKGLSVGFFIGTALVCWGVVRLNRFAPIICAASGLLFGAVLAILNGFPPSGILTTSLILGVLGALSKYWVKGVSVF